MAGLILKLRPREQLLINGVVVENGDRKAQLRVCTEGAQILRLRDAMRPEEATTPLKRAYFAAQTAVSGDLKPGDAAAIIENALGEPEAAVSAQLRDELNALARAGDFYKAMRLIGQLIEKGPASPATSKSASASSARPAAS